MLTVTASGSREKPRTCMKPRRSDGHIAVKSSASRKSKWRHSTQACRRPSRAQKSSGSVASCSSSRACAAAGAARSAISTPAPVSSQHAGADKSRTRSDGPARVRQRESAAYVTRRRSGRPAAQRARWKPRQSANSASAARLPRARRTPGAHTHTHPQSSGVATTGLLQGWR